MQITYLIGSPPFTSTFTDVEKLINGDAEEVKTVSLERYGFVITGELYTGSIILSSFFSQDDIIKVIKTIILII